MEICLGSTEPAVGAAATWRVARGLDRLRDQVDGIAPDRSKESDGSIGDPAHCGSGTGQKSDHCAKLLPGLGATPVVTARDITHDPDAGADMDVIADQLRLSRDRRIKYVIWDRRIYSGPAGPSPWVWRPYAGSNPHDKHMHVSVVPTSLADDTTGWEITMSLTDDDVRRVSDATAAKVLGRAWPNPGQTLAGTIEASKQYGQQLLAAAAADETRDRGLAGAVEALTELLRAGGGDADTAAILARVDERAAETNTAVAALRAAHQTELDSLHAELDAARTQLAALPDAVVDEQRDRLAS